MPRHILVIDRESDILMSLETVLSEEGFAVTCAQNGEAAIRRAQMLPLDMIIMDLRLPDIDGRQLIRRLRILRPRAVILLLTGALTAGGGVPCTDIPEGVTAVLAKPLEHIDQLIRLVTRLLADHPPAVPGIAQQMNDARHPSIPSEPL